MSLGWPISSSARRPRNWSSRTSLWPGTAGGVSSSTGKPTHLAMSRRKAGSPLRRMEMLMLSAPRFLAIRRTRPGRLSAVPAALQVAGSKLPPVVTMRTKERRDSAQSSAASAWRAGQTTDPNCKPMGTIICELHCGFRKKKPAESTTI